MKTIPVNLIADRQAEVLIYDQIGMNPFTGEGVSSKGFADNLAALGELDTLTVRINSPGGSVFEGMAIYNALVRNSATVNVQVDGIAGSAASFIAMAGDHIAAAENSSLMIHRASGGCDGNCNDMRQVADILERLDGSIAGVYASRTGRRADTFLALMEKEKWFSPEEALKNRLIDEIIPNKGVPVARIPKPRAHTKAADLIAMAAMVNDIRPRVKSPLNLKATLAGYAARAAEVAA